MVNVKLTGWTKSLKNTTFCNRCYVSNTWHTLRFRFVFGFYVFASWVETWVHLALRPLFGLLYQPQMIDFGDCEAVSGMQIGRGDRSTRRKPAPVSLCSPQIPHDLTQTRTRAAAVGSLRLTAWAMARTLGLSYWYLYKACLSLSKKLNSSKTECSKHSIIATGRKLVEQASYSCSLLSLLCWHLLSWLRFTGFHIVCSSDIFRIKLHM
jgi:hypothetical protein